MVLGLFGETAEGAAGVFVGGAEGAGAGSNIDPEAIGLAIAGSGSSEEEHLLIAVADAIATLLAGKDIVLWEGAPTVGGYIARLVAAVAAEGNI